MVKREDIRFLVQLTNSLNDAQLKLEEAYKNDDRESFNRAKVFMLKIQKRISEVLG